MCGSGEHPQRILTVLFSKLYCEQCRVIQLAVIQSQQTLDLSSQNPRCEEIFHTKSPQPTSANKRNVAAGRSRAACNLRRVHKPGKHDLTTLTCARKSVGRVRTREHQGATCNPLPCVLARRIPQIKPGQAYAAAFPAKEHVVSTQSSGLSFRSPHARHRNNLAGPVRQRHSHGRTSTQHVDHHDKTPPKLSGPNFRWHKRYFQPSHLAASLLAFSIQPDQ